MEVWGNRTYLNLDGIVGRQFLAITTFIYSVMFMHWISIDHSVILRGTLLYTITGRVFCKSVVHDIRLGQNLEWKEPGKEWK